MPEFPLILGGRENKLYFAFYGARNRAGGGKTREISLYQKIILFASKKPHSCRNT
ncbi:hypothetical protein [Leptospira weilii]|uniref:hypothetical protein n=1 Tax=Leptospira weilii TaxID=28184 RepID=UPI0002D482D9|nr:hypothetical protein [Leptospira weilii]ULH27286.1 hypothetical protein FH586_12650 [Leptospira weilii]